MASQDIPLWWHLLFVVLLFTILFKKVATEGGKTGWWFTLSLCCLFGGLCLGVWMGYQHGKFGDQYWQMHTCDETTRIIVGRRQSLDYEARWSRGGSGIHVVYRDKAEADRAVERVYKTLMERSK